MCTRDGTPEQARSAVYTMAALINPSKSKDSVAAVGKKRRVSLTQEKQQEAFGSLLKSLTMTSRMTLTSGNGENVKIVSILTALTALAESAPSLFEKDSRGVGKNGEKAIKFAIETCLLGRDPSADNDSDSEGAASEDHDEEVMSEDEMSKKTPKGRRRKSALSKNTTPDGAVSAVEDESLSLTCRRLCAAIELLVSYISHRGNARDGSTAPEERIEQAFSILCQIIEDGGLPPASRDRKACRSRQDRAALRKCAATNLFRLCDARLKLDEYLSVERWHILSSSLLDEETSVRDGIMEEFSMLLMNKGPYGQDVTFGRPMVPHLRFLAMVTLCVDADHGAGHSGANASAANVGKRSANMKAAAIQCIMNLRTTSEGTRIHARSLGAAAEQHFENCHKMKLMPEYSVPYALYLLSFRRETPSAGGTTGTGLTQPLATQPDDEEDVFISMDEENQHKILRKRLKWLFEPLVHSLGDGADNISFLLRMVDLMGNNYQPISFVGDSHVASSPVSIGSVLSEKSADRAVDPVAKSAALAAAKLKTICVAAREVLLSYVKKDVNLSTYPGGIQLPMNLFRRSHPTSAMKLSLSQQSGDSARTSLDSSKSLPRSSGHKRSNSPPRPESILTSGKKKRRMSGLSPSSAASLNRDSLDSRASVETERSGSTLGMSQTADGTKRNSRVHFSPELVQTRRSGRLSRDSTSLASKESNDDSAGGETSPVAKSQSFAGSPPGQSSVMSEEKTLGTTPPSNLRTELTCNDDETPAEGNVRLSIESNESESTSGSRRSNRSTRRKAPESVEPIQSEETMTTSETQLSVDPEELEESPRDKRTAKRAASTRNSKKSKKSAPTTAKIEIKIGAEKKKSSRPGRKAKTSSNVTDEFAFSDDDGKNKENSTKRRSRKRASSPSVAKKRKQQKTKISMGSSKTSRRI